MCLLQPGVPAFTVKQPDGPMKVLQERAEEIGVRNTNMLHIHNSKCSSFADIVLCFSLSVFVVSVS